MVLLLIKLEIIHLREYNLIIIKTHSELLAHVEVPRILKKVVFLPRDSLLLSFELLDLTACFKVDHCGLAASSVRGIAPVVFGIFVSTFSGAAFEDCCPLWARATSWGP